MSIETDLDLPWIATLKRGLYYDLGASKIVFEFGIPHPISDAARQHLEEHAVERRISPGWNEDYDDPEARIECVCAFDFRPNDGSATDADLHGFVRQPSGPRSVARAQQESRAAEATRARRQE